MAWITPKTDWATTDYYNYSDLNRVENNTDYIADYIETFASRPSVGIIKTDWANTDFVFYDDLNRIEKNIDALKNSMKTPTGWTTLITNWVSLDVFDYVDANRLEVDLSLLKQMAENIVAGLLYCGAFSCGENTIL